MILALSGFALIAAIVLTGWALGRWGRLPDDAGTVLGAVVYTVLAPCLLFTGVAAADLTLLFTRSLLVIALASGLCFAIFALLFRRRDPGTRILGALAGGYTNANYIGLPIATYVLGDAALVVPIILVQLLLITPVTLVLLELTATGRASWRTAVAGPVRNPLILAVLAGVVVSVTGVRVPALLAAPVGALGQAAVPLVLLAFGMSLSRRWVLEAGPDRPLTVVAVALKVAVMPLLAFLFAQAVGLPHAATYAVTVLAALPTAQNVFLYAQQFRTGVTLVRDAVFLSTLCCLPVMLLIAALLAR
ncbi:AEC family transporter [Actinoplanes sp. NPDC024001]|uniref:AEC family transporter n=1 Tax=Actinoplanes sp. NPDC024001 TaxID=3154598 RepID=UPI0034029590